MIFAVVPVEKRVALSVKDVVKIDKILGYPHVLNQFGPRYTIVLEIMD